MRKLIGGFIVALPMIVLVGVFTFQYGWEGLVGALIGILVVGAIVGATVLGMYIIDGGRG